MAPARRAPTSARLFLAAGPGALAVLVVTSTALGLVPAAIAVALRRFVDGLTGDGGGVTGAAVLFMLAMGATAALPEVVAYLTAQCCRRIGHDGTRILYDRVNADPTMDRLERPEYQDDVQFATEATDFAPMLVLEAVLGGVQCLVTVLSLWWVMASAHPLAGALAVVGAVPAVLVQRRLARRRVDVRRALVPVQRRREAYRGLIISPVAGKELRLFGLGPFFRDRMLADLHTANVAERDLDRGVLRWQLALAAVQAALVVAVVTLTARAATAGELSAGDVTALIASFTALGGVIDSLAGHLARGREGMRTLAMFDAVDRRSGAATAGTLAVPPLTGGIRVEDVWFRYGDDLPWVLRGVTLDIPAGSSVALVGTNGAGKSTLVKLLCGLYRPTRGRITWDGRDLADCDPALLRDRIGAVFQDFMAYELTAHENIAIGSVRDAGDRARTVTAARLAGIDDDLRRLPRGYATLLSRLLHRSPVDPDGEPGVVLSGGQWQRVALARMLMRHDRDLLILDEPTAGLDAHAEHRIHEVVRTAMVGRARLLISHRLSAVRHADRIHVLDGGHVTECGDHHELLSGGGTYAELFRVQASGYLDPETAGR